MTEILDGESGLSARTKINELFDRVDILETGASGSLISATATSLAEGADATASYDSLTSIFAFGIPRGATGASGATAEEVWAQVNTDFDHFTPAFGASPNTDLGGEEISFNRAFNASATGTKPTIGVSVEITADTEHGALNRMFAGVGHYSQVRLDGTAGDGETIDTFASAIAGLAVQNMGSTGTGIADGDAIGVHGRARKTSVAGNEGDAAGVLGDAYQHSTEAGGVMGGEDRIYNNVAGRTAANGYNGGAWETALHLLSDSTGSPALAAMIVGGTGADGGKYSFWNGMNLTRETFFHNGAGAGIAGTVGINMGDWDLTGHAEKAIQFGFSPWHLWRGDASINVGANLFDIAHPTTGACGVRVRSQGAHNSYIDLQNGATFKASWFWDQSADDVKFGTADDIDLVFRRNSFEAFRVNGTGIELAGGDFVAPRIIGKDDNLLIKNNTADAADDGSVTIKGGGGTANQPWRGGEIQTLGNEHATYPGQVRIAAGTSGNITLIPTASATPTDNGDLAIEATSNASLTFKLKGTDGTVRSGSITLS